MECDRKAIEDAVSNVVDGLLDFYIKMRENPPVRSVLSNGKEFDVSPYIDGAFDVEIKIDSIKVKFILGVNGSIHTGANRRKR